MGTSKRRTTMAKLNRERKLLEKRAAKQAKKDARKRAAAEEGLEVGPPTSVADDPSDQHS
jgi:Arc/MetJ-type ribon-helix-helix transcriptional regulator